MYYTHRYSYLQFLFNGIIELLILTYYIISLHKYRFSQKEYKATIDGTIASNGSSIRGASQVLACSLLATILSLVHAFYCGSERAVVFNDDSSDIVLLSSRLTCGIIAHHATCLADTLASELGILSKASPRLITTWKSVPSGTNGGVTGTGFFWSAMGGLIIGISTLLFDFISGIDFSETRTNVDNISYVIRMLMYSLTCGLLGSIIDSLLGATVQQSYFDPDTKKIYQEEDRRPKTAALVVTSSANLLTNELVNLVSVVVTTFLGGFVLAPLFFGSALVAIR